MATDKSLERVGRIHAMARRVIANKIRQLIDAGCFGAFRKRSDALADDILAALASHDPPLLVCTADEMKEEP